MLTGKVPVEILVYPNETLQYTSQDGKSMKSQLALELQMHRYLMNAFFEEQDEFDALEEDKMDIFMNYGKFEKRVGLSMNDEKEIYIVNKAVDEEEWMAQCVSAGRGGGSEGQVTMGGRAGASSCSLVHIPTRLARVATMAR